MTKTWRAAMKKQQEVAWDEGYAAGYLFGFRSARDPEGALSNYRSNPYRREQRVVGAVGRPVSLEEVDAVEHRLKAWEQRHPDATPAEFAEACSEALKEAQS